ncbi:MAG: cytochrome c oxidase accessory protein FixG [Candidatus Azotimanducaceae bacterium]|jgi:cytochrome c oxidase accessory protein FixG
MTNPPDKNISNSSLEEQDSRQFNLYEKREKIYTRKVEGFYQFVRLFTGWPLLVGYFGIPWLMANGHQAILFDLPQRQFHIFWLTFWPQDFSLLAWALVISAFSLFFVTTLLGRVWCGYTCPQTVWTAIFMWAEQVAEGDRHQRIRLDKEPWSANKVFKRLLKHGMWIGFATLTAFTFVGYFYGIRDLVVDAFYFELPLVTVFWTGFFTVATYLNAGWMREQVCMYMCPYARFQSAMFDQDTLIVSYDSKRGENRGPRKRNVDPSTIDKGDCIDCTMCVQVCPTGIDIRDGLQYECINCAACVDACNGIMDKMGYEHGLIAYTTEHQLEGKEWTWKRPKLLGYLLALSVMIVMFGVSLVTRLPLELDIIRNRGQLFQEIPGGLIQNTYTAKVLNKDVADHTYTIEVSGINGLWWSPNKMISVSKGKVGEVAINVIVDPDKLVTVNSDIEFTVTELESLITVKTTNRLIGPLPVGIRP